MTLSYGSVCSGIEAATCAWRPLGWKAAWLAEIEPFPSALLAHRYPGTPNLGDMTTVAPRVVVGEVDAPDVLTGGTPCQAFSVAGLRKGLTDARGQLSLAFCLLADAIDAARAARGKPPCIVVWENVPGVLSDRGNAFGAFLAGLAGGDVALDPPGGRWANCGAVYGPARAVCWRVLDAQYFGVAQRRRRVWVVASARTDLDPAALLFEWEGMRRDSAPSREAREGAAGGAQECFGGNRTSGGINLAPTLNACGSARGRLDFESEAFCVTGDRTHALKAEGADGSEDGTGRGTPIVACRAVAAALTGNFGKQPDNSDTGLGPNLVSLSFNMHKSANRASSLGISTERADCLRAFDKAPSAVLPAGGRLVRRLTPTECERLQGFPDGYTLIPWRGKPADLCPDGPRYKALGNSWAVPCAAWIGRRIHQALALDPTL